MDFTPVIVKFDTYPADSIVDVVFKTAGVQTQRRLSGAEYDAVAAAGFTVASLVAALAVEPVIEVPNE